MKFDAWIYQGFDDARAARRQVNKRLAFMACRRATTATDARLAGLRHDLPLLLPPTNCAAAGVQGAQLVLTSAIVSISGFVDTIIVSPTPATLSPAIRSDTSRRSSPEGYGHLWMFTVICVASELPSFYTCPDHQC